MPTSNLSEYQFKIPLDSGFANRAAPLSSTYRMVREGLKESIGSQYLVYGHWDKLFGCWHVAGEHSKQIELLPDWPVLVNSHDLGQACGASVLSHRHLFQFKKAILGKRSSKWFAAYINDIPSVIRDLCVPFGWMQWLALDLCHQIPGFHRFLHEERQAGRLGYPCQLV